MIDLSYTNVIYYYDILNDAWYPTLMLEIPCEYIRHPDKFYLIEKNCDVFFFAMCGDLLPKSYEEVFTPVMWVPTC
jgi:hypothetical protein